MPPPTNTPISNGRVLGGVVLYFLYGMHNSELAKGHLVVADDETPYFPEDAPKDESGQPVIRP